MGESASKRSRASSRLTTMAIAARSLPSPMHDVQSEQWPASPLDSDDTTHGEQHPQKNSSRDAVTTREHIPRNALIADKHLLSCAVDHEVVPVELRHPLFRASGGEA
jgi:hypothetical protein